MTTTTLYTSAYCPFCVRAKALLERKQVSYEEIRVDLEPGRRQEMMQRSGGAYTVPQIFINDIHVGGCDELHALERQSRLDTLLNQPD